MKKILLILSFLLIVFVAKSQDAKTNEHFNISLSFSALSNELNFDNLSQISTDVNYDLLMFYNYNLRVEIPTKIKYLDLTFGTSYSFDAGSYSVTGRSYDYNESYFNGGSIYAGISPKIKFKNFGFTSNFCLGYYTYRKNVVLLDSTSLEPVDVHEFKVTSGLGGQMNLGFYLKIWRIGINPQIDYIFSGGSDVSFIFYGYEIPLVIYF